MVSNVWTIVKQYVAQPMKRGHVALLQINLHLGQVGIVAAGVHEVGGRLVDRAGERELLKLRRAPPLPATPTLKVSALLQSSSSSWIRPA